MRRHHHGAVALNARTCREQLARAGVPFRQGQRLGQPQRLTGDAGRVPDRRQDPQPLALPEHPAGERRRRLDHVLTVVQNQQRLPLADRGDEPSVGSAFGAPPSRISRRPSAASVDCATSPSAPMAASSTSQAPSGRSPSSVRAVSVASLVFPQPPGPIRVVSRCSAMSSRTVATSASLPTKLVSSARKLVFRLSCRRPNSPPAARRALRTAPVRGRRPARRPGLLSCAGTRAAPRSGIDAIAQHHPVSP